MARGEKRGGLALTEPHAGTDVQSIKTVATPAWRRLRRHRQQDVHHQCAPRHDARRGGQDQSQGQARLCRYQHVRGREERRGPTVSRHLKKLGYKGIDTCEVLFEDVRGAGRAI